MKISISRFMDDPICPRVSIGGGEKLGGFYCTYRGTREEAILATEVVLQALKQSPELEIQTEVGRFGQGKQ